LAETPAVGKGDAFPHSGTPSRADGSWLKLARGAGEEFLTTLRPEQISGTREVGGRESVGGIARKSGSFGLRYSEKW
jgi:hypothetical protein